MKRQRLVWVPSPQWMMSSISAAMKRLCVAVSAEEMEATERAREQTARAQAESAVALSDSKGMVDVAVQSTGRTTFEMTSFMEELRVAEAAQARAEEERTQAREEARKAREACAALREEMRRLLRSTMPPDGENGQAAGGTTVASEGEQVPDDSASESEMISAPSLTVSMDSSRRTIMVVGLNNAGKSALVQFLCPSTDDDVEDKDMWILPTPGLRLVQAMIDETYWKIWDMSGHGRYRRMWPYYYSYAQGIIWVVDSTKEGKEQIAIVKDELEIMLKNPDVRRRKQPIAFFCTKCDEGKAKDRMTKDDLKEVLKLDRMLKGRHAYEVFETSAMPKEGEGSTANILKGLQWLKQKTRSFVDDI